MTASAQALMGSLFVVFFRVCGSWAKFYTYMWICVCANAIVNEHPVYYFLTFNLFFYLSIVDMQSILVSSVQYSDGTCLYLTM